MDKRFDAAGTGVINLIVEVLHDVLLDVFLPQS